MSSYGKLTSIVYPYENARSFAIYAKQNEDGTFTGCISVEFEDDSIKIESGTTLSTENEVTMQAINTIKRFKESGLISRVIRKNDSGN